VLATRDKTAIAQAGGVQRCEAGNLAEPMEAKSSQGLTEAQLHPITLDDPLIGWRATCPLDPAGRMIGGGLGPKEVEAIWNAGFVQAHGPVQLAQIRAVKISLNIECGCRARARETLLRSGSRPRWTKVRPTCAVKRRREKTVMSFRCKPAKSSAARNRLVSWEGMGSTRQAALHGEARRSASERGESKGAKEARQQGGILGRRRARRGSALVSGC
jgi:hypothetical protein